MFLNLHGGEIVILILAALVILGPSRLPEYAAKLAQGVRYVRDLAEGAKGQIKSELGPGFEDIDWRSLDPRQYDPRRIVREALSTPTSAQQAAAEARGGMGEGSPGGAGGAGGAGQRVLGRSAVRDPNRPTPFDPEAT